MALLHLRRAGRPRGGSGRLTDALVSRLTGDGGSLRLGDGASAILPGGRDVAVTTASGDRIATRVVVAACHAVHTARLLGDDAAAARIRSGHGVGVALRLLTTALPAYPVDVRGAHTSMQLLVRSTHQIRAAYADLLRGEPADDPPMVVMTPTATDGSLAPAGRHVVTVWAQWHPYRLALRGLGRAARGGGRPAAGRPRPLGTRHLVDGARAAAADARRTSSASSAWCTGT